jgi:anti-sigma factor RsiW
MNCADCEILICDYVDGRLAGAEKAALESHLAECPACAELARDSAEAVAFMERAAVVEPPPELITRILFEGPWRTAAPRPAGLRRWLSGALGQVLQPRLAMGMAMTVLSLAMLLKFTKPLTAEDWKPERVWARVDSKAHYAWGRTVKFYQNLKFVYQVQTALREWQQRQQEEQRPAVEDGRKLPVKSPAGANTAPGAPSQTGETQ